MSDNSNLPAPGWYHADGDPAGTQRYWDGELWIGDAVPAPSATTPQPPVGSGQQAYPRSTSSNATTALVLGILGFVCCQLAAPFAWKIGHDEVRTIDAGHGNPADRGFAMAGKILGILGTILLTLVVLYLVVAVVIIGASSSA